jgi:CheY-like chemotaxis protein
VQDEALQILVVDDLEENLAEMQELLEELGRTVRCADSGAKALACMTAGHRSGADGCPDARHGWL